jgi:uncharacterized damage-inducible protein DinB
MTDEVEKVDSVLGRYVSAPYRLRGAVGSLTDEQLNFASTDDAWTIRQIAHHVVDVDALWTLAIKAALGNCQTPFGFLWYWDMPQDEWARQWNYAGRAIEPSLALFAANRQHVEQLVQSIPDASQRCMVVQWPASREPVSVGDIIGMQARHALAHIDEILAIRRAHGL